MELQDAGTFARSDSIDAALGARNRNDAFANLRLTWEPIRDHWSGSLHYLVTYQEGDSVQLARDRASLIQSPPDSWLNLTNTFVDDRRDVATQRIDRASVAYTTPKFVLRFGRQALTWGSGRVFRPMDLFDPFSPSATDTEYKPGTDMVYTQFLFDDGSDLQAIAVPRSARRGVPPSTNASSFALHLHTVSFGYQTTLLVARDHGDWVGGVGVNGALDEATWNLELVPTLVDGRRARFSGLANISDAMTLLNRNATVFAEYFHNGFGARKSNFSLESLPPDLFDRLGRGQVFNTRRNYLASGVSLEANPLLTISPTFIVCLDDASAFALVAATYSLSDNLMLVGGIQAPIGPPNTDFGGLPLTSGSNIFVLPADQVYVQLRRYF